MNTPDNARASVYSEDAAASSLPWQTSQPPAAASLLTAAAAPLARTTPSRLAAASLFILEYVFHDLEYVREEMGVLFLFP
ncbi:MAG: hypothetical protein LBB47_06460 [Spirochaetaceae bacterium]|nr:hypothetical protein [Spirochaetaceae bacterium]